MQSQSQTLSNPKQLSLLSGGYGVSILLQNSIIIDWVKECSKYTDKIISVYSGAFLLAKAGLLEGLKATTYYKSFDALAKLAPNTEIIRDKRFVDNGKTLTSAGVSGGIDISLYVI